MKNIYSQILDEINKKVPVALATIIGVKNSAPQIPGASALFTTSGLISGTVGGGILEGDAEKRALDVLERQRSAFYVFDCSHDISEKTGAICGGEIEILIDGRPEKHKKIFTQMMRSLRSRKPGILTTAIGRHSDGNISIKRIWIEWSENLQIKVGFIHSYKDQLRESFGEKKPMMIYLHEPVFSNHCEETLLFIEPLYPLPHLIIAGAGHIGQALSHLGRLLEFEVTVIDDRADFANSKRLPNANHIVVADIDEAMREMNISHETYIVIVTRGHKNDAEVLKKCIFSEAAYIGMIGSKRKVRLMRKQFITEKWATPAQFDGIDAPIGLDIQSKTVQEIAVSIAAKLVLVRREKQDYPQVNPWSGP